MPDDPGRSCVFLIRHAEPELRGVLLGRTDPPLSPAGRAQARHLKPMAAAVVYTSPLRRCQETAAALGRPVIVRPELAEIDFGSWDGLPWAEVERRWPDEARQKLERWREVTPPGGESWDAFRHRVLAGWQDICNGPLPAAIISHQAVLAVLREALRGEDALACRHHYCEVLPIAV